ncbi:gluconate 2-dehydrogenase subunit 3 family protein [Aureimonas sp. AU4]|uniref:gluconate 2-dehydrogenase subunit 3 family protein n=1 Tax=Aureimonas sp. AU4 TaxID=1638163 RepID=UPI000781E535|nr:gluconate 2-dehydrogenase subunit 3 family protein [Aureimonas sp. AU4]
MNEHFRPAPAALPNVPATYAELIASPERVSERLREALVKRAQPDDPEYRPQTMNETQLASLRAALARIIPQKGDAPIDLAARIDTMMAEATGNGWRYEALPTDPEAYQVGLDTLEALARDRHGRAFAELSPQEIDALLRRIADGEAGIEAEDRFSPKQMTLWFEELRSDAVRIFVAHPAVMARIGYSGIANGGPGGAAFAGFQHVGIGEREAFEPRGEAEREAFEPRGEAEREAFEPRGEAEREAFEPEGTAEETAR